MFLHLLGPAILGAAVLSTATALAAPVAADWSSTGGGTLAGVSFTAGPFPSLFSESILTLDYTSADFAFAPLTGVEALTYGATDDFIIEFAAPVAGLLLYLDSWRGSISTGPDPATIYTFDKPFSVASGLANATIVGNQLTLPDDFFHDGILLFDGPLTSLRIDSSAMSAGAQGFTLAIDGGAPTSVPAPGAATIMLAGIAGLAGLARRHRRPENP